MLRRKLKLTFLALSKYLGLFQLARFLTRRQLRILCYHGTALADEAQFRPLLFIGAMKFEERLRYLSRAGFAVLPLEDAVQRLRLGTLPSDAVVLTIDDGFYGTYKHAVTSLKRYRLPATLYVTTYYAQRQNPVFRLLVQYIFWATGDDRLDLGKLGIEGFEGEVDVHREAPADRAMWKIIDHGESKLDEDGRQKLALGLGALLGVDVDPIVENRCLGLMSPTEIQQASRDGIDIELHTHRHRLPEDESASKKEISDNRAALEPIVGRRLNHLCYPSGFWSRKHWPWLAQMGIKTATTCDVGFNGSAAHPFALKRIFDSSMVSALEFEAELNGFLEGLRRIKTRLGRTWRRSSHRTTAPAKSSPPPPLGAGATMGSNPAE